MTDLDLDELRADLDELRVEPEKKGGRSPREERIIAGFEEIQRFVEKHGRAPQHGEDRDIFERLYAVRLDRLRALADCRALLAPLDHQGLLGGRGACRSRRRRRTSTMTSFWPNLAWTPRRDRHHRASPCPHDRRQARGRGNRQSRRNARTSSASSRCSSRCRRSSTAASARLGPFETEGRNQAGRVLHRRRPEGLCRGDGRDIHERSKAARDAACA